MGGITELFHVSKIAKKLGQVKFLHSLKVELCQE